MAHIVYIDNKPVLRDDWHVEDIHSFADLIDVTLTDEQAGDVLCGLAHSFDANIGINWEVLRYAIDALLLGD